MNNCLQKKEEKFLFRAFLKDFFLKIEFCWGARITYLACKPPPGGKSIQFSVEIVLMTYEKSEFGLLSINS